MSDIDINEENDSSLFGAFMGWLMDKMEQVVQRHENGIKEMAQEHTIQRVEQHLKANPELALKAKSAVDAGRVAHGIISPSTYEMLQRVEEATNYTPPPSSNIQSTNQQNLENHKPIISR